MDAMNNKMQKRNTSISVDPRAFPNLVPVHIPQRTYQTGIVAGIIRNIKIGQIEKESERMAKIAENQLRMVSANCQMVREISTLSASINAQLVLIEDHKQLSNEMVLKAKLENQLLYHQVEQEKIASEMAKRNFKEMYPDDAPQD
jgi:hypothetical protein